MKRTDIPQMKLTDFPSATYDKLRYSDSDGLGHVNNAIFSTFLETGRIEFLYADGSPLLEEQATFVIAALDVHFLHEIKYPGRVDIGTGMLKVGKSSLKMYQQIYQGEICVASAVSVLVQIESDTGQSKSLSDAARAFVSAGILEDIQNLE
jgi:acyl-CoA thioester hydrolase